MDRFTFENQGANTYLVYTINDNESIDTLSLGMITNNKISGILPVVFTQMDDKKYFKYTISSKISIKQFFTGVVNKKRLLGVLHSIAAGVLAAEEYMIESTSLVFDVEYIYVDVSTCEASLACLPVLNTDEKPLDLRSFFKNIVFSTQFDQTENCDYVAKIISYLNSTSLFSLSDFKRTINELLVGVQQKNVTPEPPPPQVVRPQVNEPLPNSTNIQAPVINKTVPPNATPEAIAMQKKLAALKSPIIQDPPSAPKNSPNVGFAIPGQSNIKTAPGKEDIKNDKIKKDKPQKEKKGLFSFLHKKSTNDVKPPVEEKNPRTNIQQPPFVKQPASIQNPSNSQQGMPSKPAPQQPPKLSFGETTVLGGQKLGETTVLGGGEASLAKPFLIRSKNNEKIYINKPVFVIGKEKSYVDYCISGNSAISRSHANIISRDGNCYVVDTNSTNHTFVDGVMIQSNTEIKIAHATKLRFANEEFEFRLY